MKKSIWFSLLAGFVLAFSSSAMVGEVARISCGGYRLLQNGNLGAYSAFDSAVATVSIPDNAVVYRNPLTTDSNQNVLEAQVGEYYKVAYWMRSFNDPAIRAGDEKIAESDGLEKITIGWDDVYLSNSWVYVTLVVEPVDERVLTVGTSRFGKGVVMTNGVEISGACPCRKGDVFDLTAVAAFDDKHGQPHATFVGWSDGVKTTSRRVVVETNASYLAVFRPTVWVAEFSPNGGTVEPLSKYIVSDSIYGKLPVAKKPGYIFSRWEFEDERISDSSVVMPCNQTLIARWTATDVGFYYVEYYANGGQGLMDRQLIPRGERSHLADNCFWRNDWTFLGWSTDPKAEAVNFNNAQEVLDLAGDGKTIKLYAVWTENPVYYIRYVKCAPSGSTPVENEMAESIFDYQKGGVLSLNVYTRVGYEFCGWSLSELTNEVNFADGQRLFEPIGEIDEHVNIYTVWDPISYTVRFDPNATDVTDFPDDLENGRKLAYDEIWNIDMQNVGRREGYELIGWDVDKEAHVPTHKWSGAGFDLYFSISNLTTRAGDTVTLYAIWAEDRDFTLSFDTAGGVPTNIEPKSGRGGTALKLPDDPVREGYRFAGWWYEEGGVEKRFDDEKPTMPNADTVLVAHWDKLYTLTLQSEFEADKIPNKIEAIFGEEVKLPTSLKHDDYVFGGWYEGTNAYVSPMYMPARDLTLVALWTGVEKFTMTFNSNGGSAVGPITLAAGKSIDWPADPTREGYVFQWWYETDENTKYENPGVMPARNVQLTAKWDKLYAVTLVNEAVTNELTNVVAGTTVALPKPPPRDGYAFGGWEDKDAGTNYVSSLIMPSRDVTLTARWTQEWTTYTICFNPSGGEGAMGNVTATNDLPVRLPENQYTRDGYLFTGWTNSAGVVYADQAVVSNDLANAGETCDLYATWKSELSAALFGTSENWLEVVSTNQSWFVADNGVTNALGVVATLQVKIPGRGELSVEIAGGHFTEKVTVSGCGIPSQQLSSGGYKLEPTAGGKLEFKVTGFGGVDEPALYQWVLSNFQWTPAAQ